MIKTVKVNAHRGTYEVTTTNNFTDLYMDINIPDEVIAFIQNENVHKESLSSAVCIYSL